MDSLEDRVAKAIYLARHMGANADEDFGLHDAGKLRGDLRNVDMARKQARAAMKAMRDFQKICQ